jgi:HK97 family phage prohead protease
MNDQLEYRTATDLTVRHAQRMIDLIAVPYNEPVEVMRRARWVTESVDPDAFTGVHGDVTVNRAHDLESPLGRVTALHPKDPRGLRAELRISRTSAGDDVLELADDGLLSASIGFMPLPGGEEWSADRSAVKVLRAKLFHIALTGDPAYKGAKVLAVRTNPDEVPVRLPTPHLDRLRLEMLAHSAGFDLPSPS